MYCLEIQMYSKILMNGVNPGHLNSKCKFWVRSLSSSCSEKAADQLSQRKQITMEWKLSLYGFRKIGVLFTWIFFSTDNCHITPLALCLLHMVIMVDASTTC